MTCESSSSFPVNVWLKSSKEAALKKEPEDSISDKCHGRQSGDKVFQAMGSSRMMFSEAENLCQGLGASCGLPIFDTIEEKNNAIRETRGKCKPYPDWFNYFISNLTYINVLIST